MSADLEMGLVPLQNAEILAVDEEPNISSDNLGPGSSTLRVSADLETGLVPPQNTEILAVDERPNISSDNLRPSGSTLRVSTQVSGTEIEQKSTGSKKCDRCPGHESGENEAKACRILERIKVVQKGYENTMIIVSTASSMEPLSLNRHHCTFFAGAQAAILALTSTQTDTRAQFINGIFFAGLVTDVCAVILSSNSLAWFETTRLRVAEQVYDSKETRSETRSNENKQVFVEGKTNSSFSQSGTARRERREEQENVDAGPSATPTDSRRSYGYERAVCFALGAPNLAVSAGFYFMIIGVMAWVWAFEGLVAKVLCVVVLGLFGILLLQFLAPHDRQETLRLFGLTG